jgi:predicted KAP-like P-loop ATPase
MKAVNRKRKASKSSAGPPLVHVNPTGLSDAPSKKDALGFAPYVRALAWFLASNRTLPPLTVSVEGPWGSGKSSFMLQLMDALAAINQERKNRAVQQDAPGQHQVPDTGAPPPSNFYCVTFNAWRSDKDEALWAVFAIAFMKQLEKLVPLRNGCGPISHCSGGA